MNTVLSYLNEKNISYKLDGSEAILKCPNCGKEKLYLNINSEVFHCFRCEAEEPTSQYAKGHFSQLKEMWGDIVSISSVFENKNQKEVDLTALTNSCHEDLLNNKDAMKYLLQRGIEIGSIHKFKLGYLYRYNQGWISIPSFEDGIPKLLKYRRIPPEVFDSKYIREEGAKSILFNGDIIDRNNEIILTEGEIDAISLIQQGYKNVVGITGGVGTLLPEWYDKLRLKEKIFTCYDTDDDGQGQSAAEKVWATRLGKNKCWNIVLPKGYDLNSFFMKYDREDFEKLKKKAKKFKIEGILSLRESLVKMYKRSIDRGSSDVFELPWPSLNRILPGGFPREKLMVLSGAPGVGKTSMGIEMCYHFSKVHKIPTLFFCMEMLETDLATKIIQLDKDLTFKEINYDEGLIWASELGDLPIYFGYSSRITPQIFYNTMKECRDRFGIEFGVFDNLQRLIRTGQEADMAIASGMFKDITTDLRIPFALVSHHRKLNEEREPTQEDLKGSQAIPADTDFVVILHRRRRKDGEKGFMYLDPVCKVIVDKSRFSSGGITRLYFQGDKSKFVEMEDIE